MERNPLLVPEIERRLRERFGEAVLGVEDRFGQASVSVTADAWVEVATFLRDEPSLALDFLDFTTGVDRGDEGIEVISHLFSTTHAHSVRIKVLCAGEEPVCPTLSGIFAGSDWHERETAEMFGVRFEGHPNATTLLLSDQFEGMPLRKDFTLMSREVKPWPGDVEGEEEE